tara:strand:- start:792 stop:947 length:156 start_codon:yes stop_codon:yes gene_type:complete
MKSKCCNSYPINNEVSDIDLKYGRSAFIGVCSKCEKPTEFNPIKKKEDKKW